MKCIDKLIVVIVTLMIGAVLAQEQAGSRPAAAVSREDTFTMTAPAGCGASFAQAAGSPIGVGVNPGASATGDFNQDGKTDLAVANQDANNVTILLGNGAGGFVQAAGSPVPVGQKPGSIAVGEFNGDGKLDLAVANRNANTLTILLGNGTGGFAVAAGSPVTVGMDPIAVASGDFNFDGKADLVVVNVDSNNLTILSGNGAGGFAVAAGSPLTVGTTPVAVALADFNQDGKVDLAVANSDSNNLTVLINNGVGGFAPAAGSPITVGTGSTGVAAGDFNQDGKADLAVVNELSRNVTILSGNGAGGFAPAAGSAISAGREPTYVAVADFNQDGKADLLVSGSDADDLVFLYGNGAGGFAVAAGSPLFTAGPANALVVADFNRDGKPDFAVAQGNVNIVAIYLNTCTAFPCIAANFSQPAGSPIGVGVTPTSVATGDFNRDGNLDMAVSNRDSANVSILLGDGAGDFMQAAGSPMSAGAAPNFIAAGDFNLDGKADLAVADIAVGSVLILLGNGAGGFTQAGLSIASGGFPICIDLADFNRDGKTDLAVANADSDNARILLGNGAGGFTAGPPIAVGMKPSSIGAGDFNRDGKADLAVTNLLSNNVNILFGDGAGGVTAGPTVAAGVQPRALVVGEFNCDGKLDLAVSNYLSRDVTVLLGDGAGGFSQPAGSPYPVGTDPDSIATGDFNLDGRADLAVGNFGINNVTILFAQIAGGFAQPMSSPVAVGTGPFSVAVADFNRDGRPDLATANYLSASVTVRLNTCGATGCINEFLAATPSSVVSVGTSPVAIAVDDFNLDGKADLASANFGSNNASVYLSNGMGGFAQAAGSPVAVGTGPSAIAAGDFNLDGKPDLAVASQTTNNLTILLGNGTGGFAPAAGSPVAVGTLPQSVAVGDFNIDGKPDLAVANQNSNNVTLLMGNGAGGFTPYPLSPIAVGTNPAFVAVGDFDLDAVPDLAVANLASNNVTILLGNGNGEFNPAPGSPVSVGAAPRAIAVSDFNRDYKTDLAVANFNSNNLTILLGNGSGGFMPQAGSPVSVITSPRSVVAGDFNNDGNPDLAVTHPNLNAFSILLNNGGVFSPSTNAQGTGNTPAFAAVGDFRLDGKADLAIALFGGAQVAVYLNDCTPGMPPTINCPRNIIASAAAGQCAASVAFAVTATGMPAPTVTCKAGNSTITSPHTFPVGVTTVTCAASNGVMPDAVCSFTVTVQDTQPPVINCPASITAVTSQSLCPPPGQTPCQVVTYTTPGASDNCSASVVCSPASGSCFPVGVTTVTCTATDAAGNSASCNFKVTVFDVCLQDDSNPAAVVLFNSLTGDYRFCFGGVIFTGRGKVTRQGCTITLDHNPDDRRVQAKVDKSVFRGNASLQTPPGSLRCTITDRDIRNNNCACP